jgi:hypothetical protein
VDPSTLLTGSGLTGVLGLLIVAFVKGWIYTSAQVDRICKDKDDTIVYQRDAIDSLIAATQNLAVPALTSAHAWRSVERIAEQKAGDE